MTYINNTKLYYIGKLDSVKHSIITGFKDNGVMSLSEAKEKKLRYYYSGKPCKHGHLTIRYISSGCIECLRIKNRKEKRDFSNKSKEWVEKERKRKRESYLKHRDKNLERRRNYRKNNPESEFARRSLERTLSGVNLGHTDYFSVLGYGKSELVSHISKLFLKGMSWDNYGEWHIDHIKPIKVFIDEGITDPKIINTLSNLQPLWAKDNLKKGAKYEENVA
jgi:hypothetical protein